MATEPKHHYLCGYLEPIEGIKRWICVADCEVQKAQLPLDDVFRQAARTVIEVNRKALDNLA